MPFIAVVPISDEYFRYRTRVNNVIAPAIIIAAIASILGSTAIGCCAFMKLTVSFTLTDHPEAGQLRFTRNVGLWSYEGHKSLDDSDDTTCYEYPDRLEEDPSWKAAQSFGIMSGMCAAFIAVFLWAWVCCAAVNDKGIAHIMSTFALAAVSFQAMTFLFFSSEICNITDDNIKIPWNKRNLVKEDAECSLAWGGKCAILATVLWFLTFLLSHRASKTITELQDRESSLTERADNRTPLIPRAEAIVVDNVADNDSAEATNNADDMA